MKHKNFRLLGIIALAVIIGFSMSACKEPEGSGGSGGPSGGSSQATAIQLTAGVWANGNLPKDGEQWFKFTATANTQYIHFICGMAGCFVQLYDSNNIDVGDKNLVSFSNTINRPVTIGEIYYIKVTPYQSSSITYRVAFNKSSTAPWTQLPSVTQLTEGVWADGNLPYNGEEWLKFTATANTQYFHCSFNGTLVTDGIKVQLFDINTDIFGSSRTISPSSRYIYMQVESGQTYYIKVTPVISKSGTYKITFNTSSTPPAL